VIHMTTYVHSGLIDLMSVYLHCYFPKEFTDTAICTGGEPVVMKALTQL
jgi:hypothetical protein